MITVNGNVFTFIDNASSEANTAISASFSSAGDDNVPAQTSVDPDKIDLVNKLNSDGWTSNTVLQFRHFIDSCQSYAASDWTLTSDYQNIIDQLSQSNNSDISSASTRSTIPILQQVESAAHAVSSTASTAYSALKDGLSKVGDQAAGVASYLKYVLYGAVVLAALIVVHRITSWIPSRRD